MFSKEDSRKLREEFWIAFGKSFPNKWVLYKTKIKGLSFKFHFDLRKAMVSIDVDTEFEQRIKVWDKLVALKSILLEEYLAEAVYEDFFLLENKKEISRIYIELNNVSIHNKNTWRETMEFLNQSMLKIEIFFEEYKDIIDS
ncbi:DUF4268 domain-containing protein [Maribacter arcticus]|mgnify:FL=1|jgi:predicted AAA+ superfamily ATPase|uniref:DUF4268 domain-containing protein n=1 Tax=Maribacter arcticus TaxID=561365 RepID=A0A1T5BNX5_9FLAO|nr:DUF4268 domain-containing protein [Maribacter arcticus]SKB48825.1 protein of unknown function [Maribacter arcticus]|tara:strand:+ start:436 stop:861 length:426 start_codon:yes stop_codon:yes gene_type:complete